MRGRIRNRYNPNKPNYNEVHGTGIIVRPLQPFTPEQMSKILAGRALKRAKESGVIPSVQIDH